MLWTIQGETRSMARPLSCQRLEAVFIERGFACSENTFQQGMTDFQAFRLPCKRIQSCAVASAAPPYQGQYVCGYRIVKPVKACVRTEDVTHCCYVPLNSSMLARTDSGWCSQCHIWVMKNTDDSVERVCLAGGQLAWNLRHHLVHRFYCEGSIIAIDVSVSVPCLESIRMRHVDDVGSVHNSECYGFNAVVLVDGANEPYVSWHFEDFSWCPGC